MPIITITIIASRIENEEERVITLGGDTLIEIHSVNSLDKSIFFITHNFARDRSTIVRTRIDVPTRIQDSGSGEARTILFRGGRGGGRSGLRRLCILRD